MRVVLREQRRGQRLLHRRAAPQEHAHREREGTEAEYSDGAPLAEHGLGEQRAAEDREGEHEIALVPAQARAQADRLLEGV